MANSLPMGWSWSLYFAQKANLRRIRSVRLLSRSVLLTDRGRPAILKPGIKTSHNVYVDNFGIQSLEEQASKEGLDAATAAFEEKHLKVHETCEKASASGIVLDGRRLETRAQEARLRRVRSAIGVALRWRRTSVCELEVLLGHCTYVALVKRPLLSCFHTSNKYVQSTYWSRTALWSTIADELTHFRALTIFCFSQWWPPWSTEMFSTDASLYGYGLAASDWTRDDVAEAGRRSERSRYRLSAEMLKNTLWVSSFTVPAGKFVRRLLMTRVRSR